MSQLITSEGRGVYRLLDFKTDKQNTPALPIESWDDATIWNQKLYGIFWTVNEFIGPRKKENLKRIISWSVDIDEGSKESQRERIKLFLTPSMIVETKRGYQCYWNAIDATAEEYDKIQNRLVDFFGADNNAKDIARILRVPNYYHQKNPKDPFIIKLVHSNLKSYKQETILEFLPEKKEIFQPSKNQIRREMSFIKDDNLFERIYSMDCELGLERLSGHATLGSEIFSFKRVTGGKLNIFVNSKGTSCFIDSQKKIGSSDGGGPTLWQWVNWYLRDHKKTYKVMREVFPEIFNV